MNLSIWRYDDERFQIWVDSDSKRKSHFNLSVKDLIYFPVYTNLLRSRHKVSSITMFLKLFKVSALTYYCFQMVKCIFPRFLHSHFEIGHSVLSYTCSTWENGLHKIRGLFARWPKVRVNELFYMPYSSINFMDIKTIYT